MNTSALPTDVTQYIQNEIAAGVFSSQDELLATAVREHRERKEKLQKLRAEIDKGYAAIERGDYITLETPQDRKAFFDDMIRRGHERWNNRQGQG